MVFYRVLIPILALGIIVLIAFLVINIQKKRHEINEEEERLLAEKHWTGNCEFDNPETGAKCQRQEFHLENHYREVNGKMVNW